MLRLFNTTNPTFTFVFSILLVIVSRLIVAFVYPEFLVIEGSFAPISHALFKGFASPFVSHPGFQLLASGILVLFQAYFINSLVNNHKIFSKQSYLTAWIYLLLVHSLPEFMVLSPALIATTFILCLFYNLNHFNDQTKLKAAYFNAGLLTCIAFLLWYPSVVMLIFVVITLFFLASFRWSYLFLMLIGSAMPLVYLFCFYYLTDQLPTGIQEIFSTFSINSFDSFPLLERRLSFLLFPTMVAAVGAVATIAYTQKVVKEIRRFLNLLLVLFLLLFVATLFQSDNVFYILIPLLFPIAVFISVFINRIKRPVFAELVHLFLLLPLLFQVTLLLFF